MILTPTRRAARSLAEAFLRVSQGRGLLLPRIVALGALDEAPLALAGALGGLALAWFGIYELRRIAPESLPRLESIGIDPAARQHPRRRPFASHAFAQG